jgi:hypothetical protein
MVFIRPMNQVTVSMLLCAAITSAGSLRAAEPQIGQASDGLALTLTTSGSVTGSGKLKSGGVSIGDISSSDVSVAVSGEIRLGEADTLGIGVSGELLKFEHDDYHALVEVDLVDGLVKLTSKSPLPERLQSGAVNFSWTHRINDRWASLVAVSPGLRWTDSRCSSDAFALGALVGFQYSSSPTLNWKFGVAYDSMSHDDKLLPVVGMTWTPSDQWSLSVGFPRTALVYSPTPGFTIGLVGEGKMGSYHVARDPWHSLNLVDRKMWHDDSTIEYNDARVGVELGYRLSSRCSITGTIGSIVYREYQFHTRYWDEKKIKSDEAALYGSVGVSFTY